MILSDISTELKARLKTSNYFIPEREVDDLLSHVLEMSWSDLYLNKKRKIKDQEFEIIQNYFEKLLLGQPLAHLLEKKYFFKNDFYVNSSALIPRPETEILVEKAVEISFQKPMKVLDFGAGSGCIGLSIALENPNCQVWLIEADEGALKVCEKNKKQMKVKNAEILKAEIGVDPIRSSDFGGLVDLIVANPPYISETDDRVESRVFDFEPHRALFCSQQGLACIESWLEVAFSLIQPHGIILLEFGSGQSEQVLSKAQQGHSFEHEWIYDYSGQCRFIKIQKKS